MKDEVLIYMMKMIGNEFVADTKRFIERDSTFFNYNDKYALTYVDDRKMFKEFFEHKDIKSIFFYEPKQQYIFKDFKKIEGIDKIFRTVITEKDGLYFYENFINFNYVNGVLAKYLMMLKVFRLNLEGIKVSFFKLLEFLVMITDEKYLSENLDSLKSDLLFQHVVNTFYDNYYKRYLTK